MHGYIEIKKRNGNDVFLIYQQDGLLVASASESMWDEMQNVYNINVNSENFIEDVRFYFEEVVFNRSHRLGEVWR